MRRYLQNAVSRRVNYELAALKMLLAVVGNDLCARGRAVAQKFSSCLVFDFFQQIARKALGIGGKRRVGDVTCQLPMPDGGVLACRAFGQPAVACQRRGNGGEKGKPGDIADPQRAQRGNGQGGGARDAFQRKSTFVSKTGGVRGSTCSSL